MCSERSHECHVTLLIAEQLTRLEHDMYQLELMDAKLKTERKKHSAKLQLNILARENDGERERMKVEVSAILSGPSLIPKILTSQLCGMNNKYK